MTDAIVYYGNYTPVGDIIVLATVVVFTILIHSAYPNRSREFYIFRGILALLFVAASANILYHMFMYPVGSHPAWLVYVFRVVHHFCLFFELFLYVLYMRDPLHLNERIDIRYTIVSLIGLGIMFAHDILGTILKVGFYIDENNVVHQGINVFPFFYVFFVSLLVSMMVKYKDKIYIPVLRAIIASCGISFVVMFVQGLFNQKSFTTSTFLFPAFAVLYLMHANPYDVEMGAAHEDAFENHVDVALAKKAKLIIISLYVQEYDFPGKKFPKEIRDKIRQYCLNNFRYGSTFQLSGGRMIFVAELKNEEAFSTLADLTIHLIEAEHEVYHQDYKVVITKSYDEIRKGNEYISFIEFIENRMPQNETVIINDNDIKSFIDHRYIVEQLADINEKKDLDDKRILVFCQPVLNVATGKYDSAEALMRMKLDDIGMVFPDKFIPIAEEHNYIHMLSMIILAKTCKIIYELMDEGYYLKRISVNFSMMDVREKNFGFNVKQIVQDARIPFDKIAIEITESQNEQDFLTVRDRLHELKDSGITFYLDDFGTGYSNFERIMELPFDIIKFDRSLVIASASNSDSETMVSYLAHMFTDMEYDVLYEGIENEEDEIRCKKMFGKYLQGYKYSKPIPIEQLRDFFDKMN